jgi:hypothetical protein
VKEWHEACCTDGFTSGGLGNCLQVVQLWKETQRSVIDPILNEMEEISLAFQEFSFSFISRNCNKVVHLLAR